MSLRELYPSPQSLQRKNPQLRSFFFVFNGVKTQRKKNYTKINRRRKTPLKSSKATKATSEGG
jgi:hypothetical protein